MKIGLCQINPTVGALKDNRALILSYYQKAIKNGADLVVFPELVVTGYPPQDLIIQNGFIDRVESVCKTLTQKIAIPAIIGTVRKEQNKRFNSAFFCMNGRIEYIYDKILLPTYDVFDEERYFSPGSTPGVFTATIAGRPITIGLEICEDLWDDDYEIKVSESLKENGAEIIINISASPYHDCRLAERKALVEEKVEKTGLPFVYCNLVGAQDELIFDGQSLAMNGQGELIAQGNPFKEELILFHLTDSPIQPLQIKPSEEKIYDALVLGVRDYFRKTGHKEAVIGLSGGIDSSLVACIAADALKPENVHGISMPSKYSSEHSKDDARILADHLGIDYEIIPIEPVVEEFHDGLEKRFRGTEEGIAEENIQARVRGSLLMALSNKFNWLVLSTGNKTEMALGYCTLYGDMNGGLAVISDLSKTDVYTLSRWVNATAGYDRIPKNSIEKPPSAELKEEQVDPFDYDIVSPMVTAMVEENTSPADLVKEGYDSKLVYKLARLIRINEYKRRQAPPGLRVTAKAFGIGRRFPIVNHYVLNEE